MEKKGFLTVLETRYSKYLSKKGLFRIKCSNGKWYMANVKDWVYIIAGNESPRKDKKWKNKI